MRLFFTLCLILLSPRVASLGRDHSREWRNRAKELPGAAMGSARSRDFAFNLYRALVSADPGQNIFFSPLSISTSLAMLSLGARSHTKTQILEGLGLNPQKTPEEKLHKSFQQLLQELSRPRDGLQLSLGNALFTDPQVSIQDTFLSAMKALYLADSFPSNFGDPVGAKKQINDYVAKETKGKIVDLVKDLDSNSIMVMVNYIFFKAKWETSFNSKDTQEKDFHVSAETVVQVPMMSQEDVYYCLQDRALSCVVVGVPYQGNTTALFILPNVGSMEQVENGLNEKVLRKWFKIFRRSQLRLYLPKFSIAGSYQLEKVLPKLGIHEVFTSQADLSGITNHTNIQVSEMVHKAMVEVDESGTKSAAATGTVIMLRSAHMTFPRIVFDRPFLVMIVEDSTKNILFLGKVTHP
ncbi:plasma serine protease inhibitor [Elephas maximus indicus]|uniref:Serpin family A member 5 n=1 Tax=Loxodonta africana TaxID=9785 RepID=G3T0X8_LOXAF|nr:plasma serine protease inhibitor [Loxodonta africana]XP_023402302.1 plasma serine protease inhibitor [Loxodonta africana]XP_023402303.1 plasma serine protease inhibitor [Loxodonta africana]XP_049754420.1 plasma serine protease inhibitor [Elephas maximus indicus]